MASVEQAEEKNRIATDEPSKCFHEFQSMRERNEFTDVVLVCDGGEVAAHQVVLAVRSEYFRKMFLSNFKESTTKTVEFPDINKDTILLVLDYIYFNSMENISNENVEHLINMFQISHLFEIEGLMKSCWKLILNRINAENWFKIWELVLLHGNNEDIVKVLQFILDNISEIVERNFFLLNYSQLMTLLEKMNENNLPVEEKLLQAIIQWKKKTKEENVDLLTIFLELKLDFITKEFMNNLLESEKDLFDETFCKFLKRYVLPTIKTNSEIQCHRKIFSPKQTAKTIFSLPLFYFGCYRKEINCCFLYENAGLRIFDCEKQSVCKIINNLPFLFGHGIFPIQYGSDIYIIGGIPSGVAEPVANFKSKSFFLYDWENNRVVMKPSLLEEVSDPITCIGENSIYAIDVINNKLTIQYFSLLDQKWFAQTYEGLKPVACASVKNVMYVFCSRNDNNSTYHYLYTVNQLECTFHSNTPVPDRCFNAGYYYPNQINRKLLTVYRDKIFLLHRDHSVYHLYIFDPDTQLWTIKKTTSKDIEIYQCLLIANNSLMLYNPSDHSLYQFDENNADIKKIMAVKGSLEDDTNLKNLGYSQYVQLVVYQLPDKVKFTM